MSLRRLAPPEIQPASFAFTAENAEWAKATIAKYPPGRQASAVISLLWRGQEQEGWVSHPMVESIARMLSMPFIRVLEVATFYTMFMLEPVGATALIQVFGTTPCMLRGSEALMDVCRDKIGAKDHISADGKFTWQEVECLGACVNAPMAQINDYYYEDLTVETLTQIIDDFAAGKSPKPGSYAGRHTSEPAGGAQTLLDPKLYDGSAAAKITLPNLPEPEPAA